MSWLSTPTAQYIVLARLFLLGSLAWSLLFWLSRLIFSPASVPPKFLPLSWRQINYIVICVPRCYCGPPPLGHPITPLWFHVLTRLAPSTLDLSLVPFQSFWHFEKVFVPVKNNYSNSIICGNFGTLRTYILFKRIYNK